jgi:hypothetical protein
VKSVVQVAALTIAVASAAAFAADVRVALPTGGALVLPAPAGWKYSEKPGPVPTVSFSPPSGGSFQVLVSPLVQVGRPASPSDPASIRRLVERGADGARSQAVEKDLPVREFRSSSVFGNYFSATDRAPKPGEYKYLTQGAATVQGLAFTFTILSNDDSRVAVESALRMIEAARREP